MFKLASWNVNSLNVRLAHVVDWLASTNTDVLALQETKLTDDKFPLSVFEEKGYHVTFSGQKTYNGVAVISKYAIDEVVTDIDGFVDEQRRIMAVTIDGVRIINLYIPNGSQVGSEKYAYKLTWLTHVLSYIKKSLSEYKHVAVVGDFNIAPCDIDVHDPKEWEGSVMLSDAERQAFLAMQEMGLVDAFRMHHAEDVVFSWWDYRQASFRRNRGLRIDHIMLSAALAQCCHACEIDKTPRKLERPSDHAPVWCELTYRA